MVKVRPDNWGPPPEDNRTPLSNVERYPAVNYDFRRTDQYIRKQMDDPPMTYEEKIDRKNWYQPGPTLSPKKPAPDATRAFKRTDPVKRHEMDSPAIPREQREKKSVYHIKPAAWMDGASTRYNEAASPRAEKPTPHRPTKQKSAKKSRSRGQQR